MTKHPPLEIASPAGGDAGRPAYHQASQQKKWGLKQQRAEANGRIKEDMDNIPPDGRAWSYGNLNGHITQPDLLNGPPWDYQLDVVSGRRKWKEGKEWMDSMAHWNGRKEWKESAHTHLPLDPPSLLLTNQAINWLDATRLYSFQAHGEPTPADCSYGDISFFDPGTGKAGHCCRYGAVQRLSFVPLS